MHEMEQLFTMVYIDTRGTGRSDRPESEQYTTSNFLMDLEAVRRHIQADKIWLMGHSKGGALVLNYAFQNKDNVNGIILIDASGGISTPAEMMQNAMIQKQSEPWYAAASEYFSREPRDEEDWKTGIKAIMPVYFSTTENFMKNKDILMQTSLSYDAFLGQKYWHDCQSELSPKLKNIDIPVLIVVGMNDFICGPYVAKYLHRQLPHSKLLPVEDAGHFPWIEQPDVFFKEVGEYLTEMNYQNIR
jgi:proline iminopeptidase